ncbi:reverse transcriptase, partial [Klebsiella pneumoniae]|nr:reverse transcriptase [Klebsiella pneumoniae]
IIEKDKNDVAILSLDLKSFYYNIDINFDDIESLIKDKQLNETKEFSLFLNKKLRSMHEKYREKISPYISETHPHSVDKGIPIGFTSSAV